MMSITMVYSLDEGAKYQFVKSIVGALQDFPISGHVYWEAEHELGILRVNRHPVADAIVAELEQIDKEKES